MMLSDTSKRCNVERPYKVLILVLLDDALRPVLNLRITTVVLILVLLDDALRRLVDEAGSLVTS